VILPFFAKRIGEASHAAVADANCEVPTLRE
jgi:hypothetical protein